MNFIFPRIISKKSERQQIEKIKEEVTEFLFEVEPKDKDLEALDIYHAAETLLRIRFEGREEQLDNLILNVIEKNTKRGKYL